MKNHTLVLAFLFTAACDQEEQEATTTVVPTFDKMEACTDVATRSELTLVAANSDNTVALVIYDAEGFNSDGAIWGEGMEDQATVELHLGTDVGKSHCTDASETQTITEVYQVINNADLPEELQTDEEFSFAYWVMFPLCEGCSAIAEIDAQNVWFVSQNGDYVQLESAILNAEIIANTGG